MAAAAQCAAPATQCYQRRRSERTLWYRIVQTNLEPWLELASGPSGESPPAYVERTFRRYLECGILAHGFARAWPCGNGCCRCPSARATSCKRTQPCKGPSCAFFCAWWNAACGTCRWVGRRKTEGRSLPASAAAAATEEAPHRAVARYLWAMLLARIYEALPLSCPICHSQMRIIAFINDAGTVKKILDHIGEST